MTGVSDQSGDKSEKRFGRYQVIERLGAGAMGAVYRARDESLGRDVAVKTVQALGAGFQDEMFRRRFDNEVRVVAGLNHENVVEVYDVGVEGDTPYLVMELIAGGSLDERIKAGRLLSADEAQVLGIQIASALAAAHGAGIVHRDVKPGNVLEARPGKWKLADFGIAHVPDSGLTITGQFLGSPAYAAPEAIGRGAVGPATDVYGLGATLHAGLTGEPPYGPDGVLSAGALTGVGGAVTRLGSVSGLSPALAGVIERAIDRNPDARPTAEALAEALAAGVPLPPASGALPAAGAAIAPAGERTPVSNRTLALVAVAIILLIGGIGIGVGMSGTGSSGSSAPPGRADTADPAPPEGVPERPPAGLPSDVEEPGRPALSDKELEKIDRHWKKVDDKLRKGEPEKALDHLDEILRRDPNNPSARDLYRQLAGEEWTEREEGGPPRGRGKYKRRGPRGKRGRDDYD